MSREDIAMKYLQIKYRVIFTEKSWTYETKNLVNNKLRRKSNKLFVI